MLRWGFFGLLVVHGLLHFMGFAKAFGLADLTRLTGEISRPTGLLWAAAGLAMLLTGAMLAAAPRGWWWAVGLVAVILSQVVIFTSWGDAGFGTAANVLVLAGVAYGFASRGPLSLAAEYRREVRGRLSAAGERSPPRVREADLASLPEPVRRYLRVTGAVGRPRVRHVRARWRGRIRGEPDDPWMEFTAEQVSFPGEPARFFLMDATRSGLPVDVFHAFRDGAATMRVRLLSMVPLVDASGPELTRAETVTLFNDLCLLAPGELVDPEIRWDPVDDTTARARFTVGENTIAAVLHFDEGGELVNFVSDDRLAASADGTEFTRQRWSTPVGEYRRFGPWRVATRGEGRWHPPEGAYAYMEAELVDLEINGPPP